MKSKAKLQKVKAQKDAGKKPQTNNLPNGWLLMVKEAYTVMDLRKLLPEDGDIEVWQDAGIMEIVMTEKSSIDVEALSLSEFRDDFSKAFLEENQVKGAFYLSFRKEDFELAKDFLKPLRTNENCFICADTEDFQPRL